MPPEPGGALFSFWAKTAKRASATVDLSRPCSVFVHFANHSTRPTCTGWSFRGQDLFQDVDTNTVVDMNALMIGPSGVCPSVEGTPEIMPGVK